MSVHRERRSPPRPGRAPGRRLRRDIGRDADDLGLGGAPPQGVPEPLAVRGQVAADEHRGDEHPHQPDDRTRRSSPRSRASAAVRCASTRAYHSTTAAWDAKDDTRAASRSATTLRRLSTTEPVRSIVRNYSSSPITYSITPTFRYAERRGNGGGDLQSPVEHQGRTEQTSRRSTSTCTIDPSKLPLWALDGGTERRQWPAAAICSSTTGT